MRKINTVFCLSYILNKKEITCIYSIAISVLLLFSSKAVAQSGTLTGRLFDEKQAPIKYANVSVLRSTDSSFVIGALTDAEGMFSIQTPEIGQYMLSFTAIGYAEKKTALFEVTGNELSKDFGNITLVLDVKTLKEVSVTALRPTITQLADRMVVNVEGTAMAAGSSAYAVLSKAPGVFIDAEGNIQLNGRSGVTVMIDGKLTYLSARDLRTYLEGMSAENIKNIEIITNPSAKYDAEGTSGMININLRKNTQQGMNGSVYAGYLYNFKNSGYSYGGNINYKSGKWNSFLTLDANRRVGGREATFTRIFYGTNKTTYFDQVALGNFKAEGPPAVRFGTDYNLNSKHSIGMMAYYASSEFKDEFLTETFIGNAPKQPNQFVKADNFSTGEFNNFTSNLHYVGKLDTLGAQISTDLDYVKISSHREGNFYNFFTDLLNDLETRDFLYTDIPSGYDIYSAKLDFSKPLNKSHKVETGVKASHVISDNNSRFFFNNSGLVLDPLRTNHFNFKENIYAAYMNWSGTLNKKLSAQAGLRAENTRSRGESLTISQKNRRSYFNLFPSVFIQQKVNDNYGINYSYSRRLTRPNYGSLNPFRAYRDPYTWIEGNPSLRPQYTNSFSIAQTFKKQYILTVSYHHNQDVMAELPILDVTTATTIYTTGNVDDGHNVGISGIAPLKIRKWWDSQNTVQVSYAKFSMMSNNGRLENDQLFYMLQSNHTIQLPLKVRMEMNLLFRGPAASGLYHMAPMSRVDVAFKRSFMNKKFDLSVNGNDIFKGYRFLWTTDINGNVNEFDQYLRWRNVGVTLRYNFNKGQKVDIKRRNTNLEELNRTG